MRIKLFASFVPSFLAVPSLKNICLFIAHRRKRRSHAINMVGGGGLFLFFFFFYIVINRLSSGFSCVESIRN